LSGCSPASAGIASAASRTSACIARTAARDRRPPLDVAMNAPLVAGHAPTSILRGSKGDR
jgi:hypothetical protein